MSFKKPRKPAIAENDPLISLLRDHRTSWEDRDDRQLTHARWVKKNRKEVMVVGCVFEFLGLAEWDPQSAIGWKAKPRLFQIATDAKLLDGDAFWTSQGEPDVEDMRLMEMLHGIATAELIECGESDDYYDSYGSGEWPDFYQRREYVLSFVDSVLENIHLFVIDKPTPLLRELFMQGALKVGNAARSSG